MSALRKSVIFILLAVIITIAERPGQEEFVYSEGGRSTFAFIDSRCYEYTNVDYTAGYPFTRPPVFRESYKLTTVWRGCLDSGKSDSAVSVKLESFEYKTGRRLKTLELKCGENSLDTADRDAKWMLRQCGK
jgi:hypothetical protein